MATRTMMPLKSASDAAGGTEGSDGRSGGARWSRKSGLPSWRARPRTQTNSSALVPVAATHSKPRR